MITQWRSTHYDNMEFSSAENFTHSFPNHFHSEYSVGISLKGLQKFSLSGKDYIIEPFNLILIGPGQIHAHHPFNNTGWSYKSILVSPDFLKHLLDRFAMPSREQPINSLLNDQGLVESCLRLHTNGRIPDERAFAGFFNELFQKAGAQPLSEPKNVDHERLNQVTQYLAENYFRKLSLDQVAKKFVVDKYQLIRQFKKYIGVTPNSYLTMLRIEKARKLIMQHCPIVTVALETGFYDQSHFHRNFLYYTGLTPKHYYER